MISEFKDDYYFLSNFYLCEIVYRDYFYPSAEHAFQAAKTLDPQIRATIRIAITPNRAKQIGNRIKLRHGWNEIRVSVMKEIVTYKFTIHSDLKQKLLATHPEILQEGNRWGDTFWGVCPPLSGYGNNGLGKILMELRESLRAGN